MWPTAEVRRSKTGHLDDPEVLERHGLHAARRRRGRLPRREAVELRRQKPELRSVPHNFGK